MKNDSIKKYTFEIIEILENATIINIDGNKEHFDAIQITDLGIIIGHISEINKTEQNIKEEFVTYGFQPSYNVKYIVNGNKKKILKRKSINLD